MFGLAAFSTIGKSVLGNLAKRTLYQSSYELLKVSSVGAQKNVKLVIFNSPATLNALSFGMLKEFEGVLSDYEKDPESLVLIITGEGKGFVAGANIKEMTSVDKCSMFKDTALFGAYNKLVSLKKPVIAAVNGYALGGGCEIAMACDIAYASNKAIFGQPEIKIGTIPGMGGSQRLPKLVGKSKAMEMILTGEPITAAEALAFGLISKVCEPDKLVQTAIETAEKIAAYSPLVVETCKDIVIKGYDLPLTQGLERERMVFNASFTNNDRIEGMSAFVGKRKPKWTNS